MNNNDKTVVSKIRPDNEMPFITLDSYTDEYGVVHPKGERKYVELINNPLAIINRGIPMAIEEPSVTFVLERIRQYMDTLDDIKEKEEILFDVLKIFNPKYSERVFDVYKDLNDKKKEKFIKSCIKDGIYIELRPIDSEVSLRDSMVDMYTKYKEILTPYNVFIPKPKWNRDIFAGKHPVGYQYILLLKQSGEKGFSVRSAGAISDESLPEKSDSNKSGYDLYASTPIRFGEYETPRLYGHIFFNCREYL